MSGLQWKTRYAARIGGPEFREGGGAYKFERIKRAKEAARLVHPELPIIDLGVGEGDLPADGMIVDRLAREAGLSENRRYADNGTREFADAAAGYLSRVYSVEGLDPDTEILPSLGSKSLLAMLPACFIDPGDVLLMPVPAYPVIASWTRYLGGVVHELPLLPGNSFLPDLDSIPESVLCRAKLLYLNYPNNPTGAVADHAFFARAVSLAERRGIVIVHDAAYGALTYGDVKPLSFLSVPGARDVGVEVHSLSKAFNMTGWRLGFLAGSANAVAACAAVKANTDAGQFRAVQRAGVAALNDPGITARLSERYARRFALLVPALRSAGFHAAAPSGSFYCYARAPIGAGETSFASAADAADYILREANVSTVPWDEAGSYLRFSVTFEADSGEDEENTMRDLAVRLQRLGLRFGASS